MHKKTIVISDIICDAVHEKGNRDTSHSTTPLCQYSDVCLYSSYRQFMIDTLQSS